MGVGARKQQAGLACEEAPPPDLCVFGDTVFQSFSQRQRELGCVSLGEERRMNLESQKKKLFKENQAQEPIFPNWKAVFQGTKRSVA